MEGNKTICIASIYRPPNITDEAYIDKTRQEIDLVIGKKHTNILLIEGDFNLPDINWGTMRAEGTQYPPRVSQAFLDIVLDSSLEQMFDFPTRKDKIQDLLFTSHPSYVEKCRPLPFVGNSDHDIVLLDTSFLF